MMLVVRIVAFIVGGAVVVGTLFSAIATLVLPRSAPDVLTRAVFIGVRRLFDLRLRWSHSYEERDRILAFYAPVGVLLLLPAWLGLALIGYTAMFWALGVETWYEALRISGSSLLTLGFATVDDLPKTVLVFSEATIGLMLVALLIAYLPSMYAAFSRRETVVTLLEVRADNPPSAVEMILRFHRIHGLDRLSELWKTWETWFADIEESHTSLPALVFFRSPRPDLSWVTAAGAVLDAASLTLSTVAVPNDPLAALCIRAGYLALRRIADFFGLPYNPNPQPGDPIKIRREEFDAACERLSADGVPLKPDREQAWRDFAGWRVNYDSVLLDLAGLTMAPVAPWSGDRATIFRTPRIMGMRRNRPG
jgi:hypothetical protein